jgi:hypothetical protein
VCYLIQLWGGCVLQNRGAKSVTGCGWLTPERKLLQMCNRLSIKQLVFYQSVIMANTIATTRSPFTQAAKMSTTYPRRTRKANSGCIRFWESFSTNQSLIQQSFCHRATKQYNSVPTIIRRIKSIPVFKSRLKKWVETNIPID